MRFFSANFFLEKKVQLDTPNKQHTHTHKPRPAGAVLTCLFIYQSQIIPSSPNKHAHMWASASIGRAGPSLRSNPHPPPPATIMSAAAPAACFLELPDAVHEEIARGLGTLKAASSACRRLRAPYNSSNVGQQSGGMLWIDRESLASRTLV
jgi:hypothetical protein